MRSAIAVLAVPNCMDAARNASLNIVENLLDSEGELGNSIIMAHLDQLLESLKAIVVTAWAAPVSFNHKRLSEFPALACTTYAYQYKLQSTVVFVTHSLSMYCMSAALSNAKDHSG